VVKEHTMGAGVQDTVAPAGAGAGGGQGVFAELASLGQSIWLDAIDRHMLASGELAARIASGELSGLTSNPAIFQKAMAGADYAADIARLRRTGAGPQEVYEALAVADLQAAADCFRPVHERTDGLDGFVSLEVAPALAHDAAATVTEARRLWRVLDRPNAMIKVPATPAGIEAIETLLAEGINVNVTLLFDRSVYEAVAEAHLRALERRHAAGLPVDRVASVASFFVSRVDTRVDSALDKAAAALTDPAARGALLALRGRTAIANAALAYAGARTREASARWQRLAAAGARPQRLLWASTGTKNPAYRDVLYIETLIGPGTVNTVPPATLAAFADHGVARQALPADEAGARAVLAAVAACGIDLESIAGDLLVEGLRQFADAFDALIAAVARAG
jgi:transaldolase/glucose-6-phosphate isomerase